MLLIFTLMLADFFDTMGTMTAIGHEAGLLDKEGLPPRTEAIRLYPLHLFPEVQEAMQVLMHDHDGFTTEDYLEIRETDFASRVGVKRAA